MNQACPLVLWRFLDGRCGHENQVLGLSEAIAARVPVEFVDLRTADLPCGLKRLSPDYWTFARGYPRPDLLLGAGHGTHLPLLICRHLFGGRTVVLMKPSLPPALFDLCLVPRHDVLRVCWSGVVRTEGVIHRIQPSEVRDQRLGVILVGGPSRHFQWNDREVIGRICQVTENSSVEWQLVTSRRTPELFLKLWAELGPKRVQLRSDSGTSTCLAAALRECGRIWVTSDSISMIYEALTSGAATGLIPLKAHPRSRVATEIRRLVDERRVLTPEAGDSVVPAADHLSGQTEADRCAAVILQRWPLRAGQTAPIGPSRDILTDRTIDGQRTRWAPTGCSGVVAVSSPGVSPAPVLLHSVVSVL